MTAFTITLRSEGEALSPAVRVASLEVSKQVDRVPDATLVLVDGDLATREFPISDAGYFTPGKAVEIAIRYEGEQDSTLFSGRVVRQAMRVDSGRPVLAVELRDATVALTRQRRSRAYREMSDSDVFAQLIDDAQLALGQVDASEPVHAELVQYRVTDWDFLLSRAQALGCCLIADDGAVSWRVPDLSAEADVSLTLGVDQVRDLELEADGLGQVTGVEAVAWDASTRTLTEPAVGAEFPLAQGDFDPVALTRSLGFAPNRLAHAVALDPQELQGWADGHLRRNRLNLLRGRIGVPGTVRFAPFQLLELSGVSRSFSGKALISGVRHRVDDGGWQTDIALGLNPPSFADDRDLTEQPAGGLMPAVSGLQIGVIDAFESDPESEQRIRVQLPVLGEEAGAVWARLAAPYAGAEHGFVFRPELGSQVVVGFLNDDPRHAVILGAMHGSANAPAGAYAEASEDNDTKGIVTRAGTTIGFSDAEPPAVFIETPAGNKVLLSDQDETVSLTDQHGNRIALDADGITITSTGTFTLEASGEVSLAGQSIDLV